MEDKLLKTVDVLFVSFIKKKMFWIILLILVNIIIFPAIKLLQPKVLTYLFENLPKYKETKSFFDFGTHLKEKDTQYYVYIYILTWVFYILGHTLKNGIDLKLQPEMYHHLYSIINEKIFYRYRTDYKDIKIGELTVILNSILRLSIYAWLFVTQQFLPAFLTMMVISIYFLYTDLSLGFYLLCSIFIPYIILMLGYDSYKQYIFNKETATIKVWDKLTDNMNNLMNIYINNRIDKETKKFNSINNEYIIHDRNARNFENIYSHITQFFSLIFFAVAILRLLHIYKINKVSTKYVISAFIILTTFFYDATETIWQIKATFSWFVATIDYYSTEINDLLHYDTGKNIKNNINNGEIVFDNISFKYNKNDSNYLFKDFSLNIKSNEKVAILGQSGSGKTTLMKMIIDLHQPQKGKIKIDGVNVHYIDTEYLRNKVMYVNQRTTLFDKSVLYNIKYGNEIITNNKILNIVQKYQLNTVYQELNNGLESQCGVNGGKLSLGMQKTTIILRAILNDSKIIIMDEPLAGLDSKTRQKIIKLIITECKNKTLIVITHDKEILPYMNKQINLKNLKGN
uniref:ABC transporter domain-containing protein n=1 Tax=viral metagenome TaxID=1070528 RepID=A0A6C0AX18_9ZZZZ